MTGMTKIELEYPLKTSPALLFNRISTPSGLAEWFADNVIVEGKRFTFVWDKLEHQADLVYLKANDCVRFKWFGNDLSNEFEFRIVTDEITGDLALMIVDEVDEEERDDVIHLWDTSVARLKLVTGS